MARELGDGIVVDDDPSRIDLDEVHRFISTEAYWAIGRPRAVQERLVAEATRVVGLYDGGRQIGFQVVPGHGLPPQDAWIQPNDEFARSRLAEVSDYSTVLVWRAVRITEHTLSCRQELARSSRGLDGGIGSGPVD